MRFQHPLLLAAALLFALSTAGAVATIKYVESPQKDIPIVYAEKDMLQEMWHAYKKEYIEPGTNRTLDKQLNNISTSEGQASTMLRAVWMDDQETFDASWKWTKDNLQRDDKLLSWKFGQLPNGEYGIQHADGGQHSAAGGDSDVALSLLMAYSRWKDDKYLFDAQPIIASIWEREVVMINGKPVLVATSLERDNPEKVVVNPSYFSPYAYKVFARADKEHDWAGLADNSYELLKQAGESPLGSASSAGLPPNWITIDRTTGEMQAIDNPRLTTDFGSDAIRIPWRLALDYAWFKDKRSYDLLAGYEHLGKQWQSEGQLAAAYKHNGRPAAAYEAPAVYGATMGYFKFIEPAAATDIYQTKLTVLYDPDEQRPTKTLSYYDANWAWFGTALYLDELPNLTAKNERGQL